MSTDNDDTVKRVARGRPRMDAGKRRTQRIVTFVTEAELAELERRAEAEDRSLSATVHRLLISALRMGKRS